MAIVTQTDKRSGITYAYDTEYYWDKDKKQSRSKRICVGKVDPVTDEIIPTRGRSKKGESKAGKLSPNKTGPKPFSESKHLFYGATYLLESFADEIGLTHDLKQCFPDTYQKLLSIAFFLILEDNNPLYRFEKWHLTHKHPYGQDIASPRSSEFFASITDDQVTRFLRLQAKRRVEEEYWAYDSSSISSYSETLNQVQWGKNKENDKLPQINLLLVFGEKSGLPFYYRKLAGNIPDSKTVKHLLEDLDLLGFGRTKFVMDRGFSEDNINGLYREHVKFLVGVKLSLKFIKKHLDEVYDDIRMFTNYDEGIATYGYPVSAEWDYSQERPYKGDIVKDKRRIYIHYYYSIEKGADDEQAFDKRIAKLCAELQEGKLVEEHKKAYAQFFEVKDTPVRGRRVCHKEEEIKAARRYFGYFALITNEKMDAFMALHLYRMKDIVEKAFGNIKERLNLRRLLVKSEKNLDGKIFTEFVALILISHLDHKMKEANLYRTYSMQQLLDRLDVLECFEDKGHKLRIGELMTKQADIYEALGAALPTSSC